MNIIACYSTPFNHRSCPTGTWTNLVMSIRMVSSFGSCAHTRFLTLVSVTTWSPLKYSGERYVYIHTGYTHTVMYSCSQSPSTLQEDGGSGEYSTTFLYLRRNFAEFRWVNFRGRTIWLADVAIISPVLGFLIANHLTSLITPLQTP